MGIPWLQDKEATGPFRLTGRKAAMPLFTPVRWAQILFYSFQVSTRNDNMLKNVHFILYKHKNLTWRLHCWGFPIFPELEYRK